MSDAGRRPTLPEIAADPTDINNQVGSKKIAEARYHLGILGSILDDYVEQTEREQQQQQQ
jgi:hypothetical protein